MDRKTVDPRIKLTLLPIVGFTSFFISDTILLFGLILFAFFCMYTAVCGKEHYALFCFL